MVQTLGQTPTLGAAIFGAVAAGKDADGYEDVETVQEKMTGTNKVYKKLYKLYRQLHDGFGLKDRNISMYNVMKGLLDMRDNIRRNLK